VSSLLGGWNNIINQMISNKTAPNFLINLSPNKLTTVIYEFKGYQPVIHESAFIHPQATE